MDRKELQELENKGKELKAKQDELKNEIINDDNLEKYNSIETDEEKKKEFPELFAKHQKLAELDAEKDALIDACVKKAEELVKVINEKVQKIEKKVEMLSKEEQEALDEIKQKDTELNELKESDEYKNGDEAAVIKAEKLEIELKAKVLWKNTLVDKITQVRKEIKNLQKGLNELVEGYGEEILVNEEPETPEQPQHPTEEGQEQSPTVENEENQPETEEQQEQQQQEQQEQQQTTSGQNPRRERQGRHNSAGNSYTNSGVASPIFQQESRNSQQGQETQGQTQEQPKEEKSISEEHTTTAMKVEFKDIYSRAKKGKLTEHDYNRLVEIMKDPNKYDELGITTGIIFNKSRVILKAMANLVSNTKATATESREKLGLRVETANKENGYISTASITEWSGLKAMLENPERKIASEALFERIVVLYDREELSDERKEVWDKAQDHLSKFKELREVLEVYGEVTKQRSDKARKWSKNTQTNPALPSPQTKDTSLGDRLVGQTEPNPNYDSIPYRESSTETIERTN